MIKKSLLTAAAATAALALAAAPAMADRDANDATGMTKLTLNKPTLNKLTSGSCGALSATAVGNGTVRSTARSLEVMLPVTKVVLKDNHPDAIQVQHDGSGVTLENSCYLVKLTSFRIQNFQDPDQTASLDVDARTKSVDDNGTRQVLFTLDLSGAAVSTSDHRGNVTKQRISSAALRLAADGAAEFNELVTGSEATGPFSQNDQVGAAKTQAKYSS